MLASVSTSPSSVFDQLAQSRLCAGHIAHAGLGARQLDQQTKIVAREGEVFAGLVGGAAGLVATGFARGGAGLDLLATLALTARFLRTTKIMPAGVVAAAGARVVVACALVFVG